MKPGDFYDREKIMELIPHRGRNLVVDDVEFFGEESNPLCRSTLLVSDGDGDGRDIFLFDDGEGRVYSDFVLVEHVALTSSVRISPYTGDGRIAFFSTITNFRSGVRIPAGEKVTAVVTPLGKRGPFHRSVCLIERPDGGRIEVDMMAAVLEGGMGGSESDKKKTAPPEMVECRPIDAGHFAFKDPSMVFVDEECALDRENMVLTAGYHYPEDHPFVAGHFPGNPVMMGVAQWAGVLDCALWTVSRLSLGEGTWTADGVIVRADGSLVTEIKGLKFKTSEGVGAPLLLETRRIGFRDVVRAGEQIYYRVGLKAG